MKALSTIILLIFFNTLTSCIAQPSIEEEIIKYLKKEKFRLELFELAMCKKELLSIIEKDTSFQKVWNERVSRIYDERLNDAELFFHLQELNLFNRMLNSSIELRENYPVAFEFVKNSITLNNQIKSPLNFSEFFIKYIEYPEDVDPACLIVLMCFENDAFSNINLDKISLMRFNEWLNYGFEEFRYYPGTKSIAQSTLNRRIIEFIKERHKDNSEPLVDRSLKMINKIESKYKKEK